MLVCIGVGFTKECKRTKHEDDWLNGFTNAKTCMYQAVSKVSMKFSVLVHQTKKAFLTFEGRSPVLLYHLNSCGKNHPQLVFFVT